MATFANDNDILDYEPSIKNFGIQEFTADHEKTYDDIIRLLQIRWFPTADFGRYNLSVVGGNQRISPGRLNPAQFKRAAVYHVLAYYIYPKLSTFDPEGDVFREKLSYYKAKFEEELDLILRDGVQYDLDSSGTYSDDEKVSFYNGRLQR